jgi:hypothetical protein
MSQIIAGIAALTVFFSTANLLAQIELKTVIPGRPATVFGLFRPDLNNSIDFTGDGIPDLLLFKTDSEGNTSLAIVDGADYVIWRALPVPILDDRVYPQFTSPKVIGGFELDGNTDSKEIIIAIVAGDMINITTGRANYMHPLIIDLDGNVMWDGNDKILVGVAHVGGDESKEIIVADPLVPHIEVYGNGSIEPANIKPDSP